MKKEFLLIILITISAIVFGAWKNYEKTTKVTTFEGCVALGRPVMESYPRRCSVGTKTFTEDIGNALEKTDLIRLETPSPNSSVGNSIFFSGEARGYWFFEASFPIRIEDDAGNILANSFATAQGDPASPDEVNWMTEDFVPFSTTINLTSQPKTLKGKLILMKDNPSGLPEHDDALIVPVVFGI